MALRRPDDSVTDVAKRVLRPGVAAAGTATGRWRVLPDFLVVGAQRCGTTSLHRALAAHPQVATPLAHKGVHYFDTSFTRSLAWYRGHFPTRVALRRKGPGPHLAFESSPYYMFHPAVPDRIARTLPGVRAVAVLRDPVERAYSQYTHELARGFEDVTTFEEALELEPERLRGEQERLVREAGYTSFAHQHQGYAARSEYGVQLERLHAALGRDRVLVLDFEDLAGDPETVLATVQDFLGLAPHPAVTMGHHNPRPRSELGPATAAALRERLTGSDEIVSRYLGKEPSWRR